MKEYTIHAIINRMVIINKRNIKKIIKISDCLYF